MPKPKHNQRGVTLIEMMIVIVLISVAAYGVSFAFSALTKAQLRSACMKVSAAARYAYNRSISEGTTVRIAFDLDEAKIGFEEAHGRVTLARTNDRLRREISEEGEDVTAVDPWESAQARLQKGLKPSFGASPFSAITGSRYASQSLGGRIRILKVILPHEPNPRERGKGHLYFFPGGQTEHAIIQVTDGDSIFTVEVHPLTGRTRIYNEAYEPRHLMEDGEGEQRSEIE